jgi:hypothetical protein
LGKKCLDILQSFTVDFILLQETNPIYFYKELSNFNVYYHELMIERCQGTTYERNDCIQIENSNLYIPNTPNNFVNVQPNNTQPQNSNNGFIQILPKVFVPENSNGVIYTRSYEENWGSAIIANKKYELIQAYAFRSFYVGSPCLMCYDFKLSEKRIIMNLYGKPDYSDEKDDYNGFISYYNTTIHRMLSDIKPIIDKININKCKVSDHIIVLGGDLNAIEKDKEDKPVFDRINNLPLKNCTPNLITYVSSKGNSCQDDYLFMNEPYNSDVRNVNSNFSENIKQVGPHALVEIELLLNFN